MLFLKLPIVSGKEALTKAGFVVIRQRGSHVRLEKLSDGDIIKIAQVTREPSEVLPLDAWAAYQVMAKIHSK